MNRCEGLLKQLTSLGIEFSAQGRVDSNDVPARKIVRDWFTMTCCDSIAAPEPFITSGTVVDALLGRQGPRRSRRSDG